MGDFRMTLDVDFETLNAEEYKKIIQTIYKEFEKFKEETNKLNNTNSGVEMITHIWGNE